MQGMIVMWSGSLTSIPAEWHICDGTAGTPDLRDKFIMGVISEEEPGALGGSNSHSHTVDIWASEKTGVILSEPSATRERIFDDGGKYDWASSGSATNTSAGKREVVTVEGNVPEFYKLAFIMKL